MSAARLIVPKPTTTRHGDQVRRSGAAAWVSDSDTFLLTTHLGSLVEYASVQAKRTMQATPTTRQYTANGVSVRVVK